MHEITRRLTARARAPHSRLAFERNVVRRAVVPVIVAAALAVTSPPAMASPAGVPPPVEAAADAVGPGETTTAAAAPIGTAPAPNASPSAAAATTEGNVATHFIRDVGGDYWHFLSKETAASLGVGGLVAAAVHPVDKSLSQWAVENDHTLTGGDTYGLQLVQMPVAIGVWVIGAAAGSGRIAEAGRDLVRAQISVVSWTYAIKVAADRTRPNGDSYSFPSGHASNTFATAMVLQEHFGWKAGLPAFAAAAYTAFSRVTANQHWASDVVMGAAVGVASGRTVTIQLRETRLSLGLLAVPGGGGVLVSALR